MVVFIEEHRTKGKIMTASQCNKTVDTGKMYSGVVLTRKRCTRLTTDPSGFCWQHRVVSDAFDEEAI